MRLSSNVIGDNVVPPHVDIIELNNYMTCIYYVNDSDGDTVIYNETEKNCNKFTEFKRITPKRGRLLIFNGNRYHSENFPRSSKKRVVINFNFTVK